MQAATRKRHGKLTGFAREYVDTTKFEYISMCALMSPIAAVALWIAFLVMFQTSINEQARIGTVRMSLVEDLRRILADFVVDVAHLSAQSRTIFRDDTAGKTTKSEVKTLDRLNLLVFGGDVDTSDGTVHVTRIGTDTYGEQLLLVDACSPLVDSTLEHLREIVGHPNSTWEEMDALHTKCISTENGILQEGAYGAVIELVAKARRLQIDRPRPDLNRSLFFNPERRALHKGMASLETPFIRQALAETSFSVETSLASLIQSGRSVQLICNIAFACAFAVLMAITGRSI